MSPSARGLTGRRTGMLPAALSDSLIAGMLSEDPAVQVTAAGRLVAFEDADAALTAEIPGDTLTRARAISDFTLPGLTPARVVQVADERIAQLEREEEGQPPGSTTPAVPEESTDEGNSGKPPVGKGIIQARRPKPAADPFQLTPKQENQARQTIAIVDNQGADKLTHEERITALEYLRGKPNLTSQERKAAIKIFSTFEIDPAFEKWEKPKRQDLLDQLPEDGIIKNALKNWLQLTSKEILKALDRALEIHAANFEIEKPKVRLKKLGLPGAQYDQRTNTITIDVTKIGGILPAVDTIGNIIHEAAHAQQFQLETDFLGGRIKSGDPRWLQAQIFALNDGQLYSRPLKPGPTLEGFDYVEQPVEKHAKVLADQVGVKLFELRN